MFSTAVDNQPLVSVHVLQGEREMAGDNKTLARFELVGIPPAPRGVPQIEVNFDIDANGIVHVSAKDLGTGKQQQIRITASSGLTEEDIQRMIKDADAHSADDKRKKELADLKNNAEGLLYTTEKSLEEYSSALKAEDLSEIRADVEALKLRAPHRGHREDQGRAAPAGGLGLPHRRRHLREPGRRRPSGLETTSASPPRCEAPMAIPSSLPDPAGALCSARGAATQPNERRKARLLRGPGGGARLHARADP